MPQRHTGKLTGDPVTRTFLGQDGRVKLVTFVPWTLVKRGVKRQIIEPDGTCTSQDAEGSSHNKRKEKETPLCEALGLAFHWLALLEAGAYKSISEIAAEEGIERRRACRIAQMSLLAPEIIESCIKETDGLKLEHFIRRPIPMDWEEQRRTYYRPNRSA